MRARRRPHADTSATVNQRREQSLYEECFGAFITIVNSARSERTRRAGRTQISECSDVARSDSIPNLAKTYKMKAYAPDSCHSGRDGRMAPRESTERHAYMPKHT